VVRVSDIDNLGAVLAAQLDSELDLDIIGKSTVRCKDLYVVSPASDCALAGPTPVASTPRASKLRAITAKETRVHLLQYLANPPVHWLFVSMIASSSYWV
jgi:hypothetical protein